MYSVSGEGFSNSGKFQDGVKEKFENMKEKVKSKVKDDFIPKAKGKFSDWSFEAKRLGQKFAKGTQDKYHSFERRYNVKGKLRTRLQVIIDLY